MIEPAASKSCSDLTSVVRRSIRRDFILLRCENEKIEASRVHRLYMVGEKSVNRSGIVESQIVFGVRDLG